MKLSTETGEEFSIHDDVVTSRLNFRRRLVFGLGLYKKLQIKV